MRKEFLSFSPPLIGEEEIQEVVDTLRSDWITTGPKTKRFEEAFARFVGAPGALGLNSCTAGLHTALVTAGIGPGDEVVTTTLTFAATVNVIEQVGNVAMTNVLQDAWARGQNLTVHGWCYGLKDGLVKDLGVSMSRPGEVMEVFRNALKRYPREDA